MNDRNESRPATQAELHGCVGGMGVASKVAVVREVAPRPRGHFLDLFRPLAGGRAESKAPATAPARVCTSAGCA